MASMPMGGGAMNAALAQQVIRALAARQGGAGAPPGAAPGMGPGGEAPAAGVGQSLADIQGADPQAILGILNQIKQQIVGLIPATAFRLAGVAKQISPMIKYIDAAIKETEQALQTTKTISGMPIGMAAAQTAPGLPSQGAGGMGQ